MDSVIKYIASNLESMITDIEDGFFLLETTEGRWIGEIVRDAMEAYDYYNELLAALHTSVREEYNQGKCACEYPVVCYATTRVYCNGCGLPPRSWT